nr:acyl-CoA thioesterase [Deltaproteobacteria bacterium]
GPDLNHHGTLFAGQCTKWFVESGFIAAANAASPESTVCVNIHGMVFKKRILPGTIIRFESKVILAGRSRLLVYVRAMDSKIEELIVDGFLTFVHVDPQGRSLPHGITIEAATEEDIALQERAKALST